MLILNDYGELNQSQLMSYSGLNNVKHKPIIDELVRKASLSDLKSLGVSKTR